MIKRFTTSKLFPFAIILGMIVLLTISFVRGSVLVRKSEKEINPTKQILEAEAGKYNLKEIDTKTGELRWRLTAKEGMTEDNLQAAVIKGISAEVYKNNKVIFELNAPFAKANSETKEIYLFGEVTTKNKEGNFLLKSNQIALGMGTSIEAQKGFDLVLKDTGTVSGESALINDDQTKIVVKNLKEASLKDIILSGGNVVIEKNKNGDLDRAVISNNGKIILKSQNNSSLNAENIKWEKSGEVEATKNITYSSGDKTFKAGYILLKPDKKLYAKNNVSILHGQTQCSGNNLTYENNSIVIITGSAKAIQGDKLITADKIVYNIDTEKVDALGNVRTIVASKTKDANEKIN